MEEKNKEYKVGKRLLLKDNTCQLELLIEIYVEEMTDVAIKYKSLGSNSSVWKSLAFMYREYTIIEELPDIASPFTYYYPEGYTVPQGTVTTTTSYPNVMLHGINGGTIDYNPKREV